MSSFAAILRFEVAYYLRRPSTWIYFALFFGIGFLFINVMGGAFGSFAFNDRQYVNSPTMVVSFVAALSVLLLLVYAAIFGHSGQRDFETVTHPLFFTSSVSKPAYLGGRFLGALLVSLLVSAGLALGYAAGELMPYLEADRFGPFRADAYAQAFALFIVPNLVLTGALFFALAALTRQMLANYVGSVALLVGYFVSQSFLADLDNRKLGALLDPFGFAPVDEATRYWSVAEKNALLAPISDLFLANRAIWGGLALLVMVLFYLRFEFAHAGPQRRQRARAAADPGRPREALRPAELPPARQEWGWRAQWQQLGSLARREFVGIAANTYFRAIVAIGLILLAVTAYNSGTIYDTPTYPVTYSVLDSLSGNLILMLMVIIVFQAGELVWRDRQERINGIMDSTPAPTWIFLAAKWAALVGMVAVLLAVVLLFGIATQVGRGYFKLELGLYFQSLGFTLLSLSLWSMFALAIHAVVNHKYVGHVLVIGYFVGIGFLGYLGAEHSLFQFNSGAVGMYSDMNRWGARLGPYFLYKLFWTLVALLLALLAHVLWVRGAEGDWRQRGRIARDRFTGTAWKMAVVSGVLLAAVGGLILYNTNILNAYETSKDARRAQARYERDYKRFEGIPQPRITAVDVRVDLFPERHDLRVNGRYTLVNRTAVPIDSVHVDVWNDLDIDTLGFSRPARPVLRDAEQGYYIFRLAQPLLPGDSLRMRYALGLTPRGFADGGGIASPVRDNGTFLQSAQIMPSIGYHAAGELTGDRERKKEGLDPQERLPPPSDTAALRNNFISTDADWIDFSATVSTSPDQIALAPGYLQRSWTENGRRVFRYEMDAPMLNFFAVLSGRYKVKRDQWKGVNIEIYYHPGHTYNLDRMIRSVKNSLAYYTEEFGPYQHRQVRIIEFPRYASFAQSFANTIPYSEGIGFIARVDDEAEDIDYPFYITAHEVAHQWWGHQVVGAQAQGSPLLSESLSEYSAFMVMEKEYGARQMRKFLEHALDEYLTGRTFESKRETPLLLAEGQQYLHYQKGGLVLYALRDAIGEERLNTALRNYLNEVKFQEPPYTTSLELYEHLRAATPDSLRYLLDDLFRHITLWDLRALDATSRPLPGGKWEVTLNLEAKKVRADSLGNETDVPMRDRIDIGVFAAPGKGRDATAEPLYLRKHLIRSGRQTVRVVVDRDPARAGIDPYHKLIDRDKADNVQPVKAAEATTGKRRAAKEAIPHPRTAASVRPSGRSLGRRRSPARPARHFLPL